MPCVTVPTPPMPTLGGGLTIPGFAPQPPPVPGACCQLVTLPTIPVITPLPITATILAGAAAVMSTKLAILMAYLQQIPSPCPRN